MSRGPIRWRGARARFSAVAGALVLTVVATAYVLGGDPGTVDGELASAEDEGVVALEDDASPSPEDLEADRDAARQEALRIAGEQGEQLARWEEERLAAERAAEQEAAEEQRRAEEQAEEEERRAEEEAEQAARAAEQEQMQLVDAQERLIELGYLVGAADGERGQQTTSALMAFQAVNGLSVDGALGPQTSHALESPVEPSLRGGPATRIEVDMDLQVLHLVEGDQRVTTMKASTGRGGTFESAQGEELRAETPVGTFTIDRRIAGEHQSSYGLGSMWDPLYFHGPWAIHGSPNVPAGPASAGCVRVALADGSWLANRVPNGTHVVLYGGTHVFTP
jgi:lipoprotein-anchoring transpeptidase ErfK/SrfK